PSSNLDLAQPFDGLMQSRADGPALDLEVAADLVIGEPVVVARDDDRPLPLGQLPQGGEQIDTVGDRIAARCLGPWPFVPFLVLDPSPPAVSEQLARADDEKPRARTVEAIEPGAVCPHER